MAGRLWTGTSGFRYWPGDVYPPKTSADDALRLYSRALNAVEMNRTFYQLPRKSSVEKWKTLVPPDFVFAAKIWKRVSHEQKLADVCSDWPTVLERLNPLTSSGGVLLLQLPKTFPQDIGRLDPFLKSIPAKTRLAIEFRHEFWFSKTVYKKLERYEVALVGVGAPGVPRVLNVRTADFQYFRLHGPRSWYKDRYTLDEMRPFLDAAAEGLKVGDVYTFFDNTIGGHAYWNAQEFQNTIAPSLIS